MIPNLILETFAQEMAKDLHKRTGRMVGFGVSGSYFETTFSFKVGTFDVRKAKVRNSRLRNAEALTSVAEEIVSKILALTKQDEAPSILVDENGRRHIIMKAETGFLTSQQVRAFN